MKPGMNKMNTPEKFRILHTEWSSGWGGQEQRILLECSKVIELGHTVIIACQPDSGIIRGARERGIPVAEVVMRQSYDPKALMDIYRLIKKHEINVVNTHSGKDNWLGGLAAKLAGTPLLVRTRHLAFPISNNPFNFINKLADGIITTGQSVRNNLIENNKIPPERIVSIPTGVPLERFSQPTDSRKLLDELGIKEGSKIVTIVAILRSVKRHDVFLDAAKLLLEKQQNLRFLIVGDGPCKDDIKRHIKELGLEKFVIMTGHREDVPNIFAVSDVVALTSDNEGVPQSLSQAMFMGRPVVAAPVGGIPDLISDGITGLFAEAGNPASFAEKIAMLINNSVLCTKLANAAHTHIIEEFTDTIMAQKTLEFYKRLAGYRQYPVH